MTSAETASRRASSSARAASPPISCVPFSRARPSLASSVSGRNPARSSASAPGPGPASSTHASPSPITTSARCASGARSPEAPTLPRDGTRGCTLVIEHADQQLHHRRAHAGQAHRQGVGAEQQHGPHHLDGERLAHAGGVRPHQVALQLGGLGGLDPHVRQVAEAGGDAVGGAPLGHQPLDHRPRGAHPLRPPPDPAPRDGRRGRPAPRPRWSARRR